MRINHHDARLHQATSHKRDAMQHQPPRATSAMNVSSPSDLVQSKPLVAAIARELWKLHGGNEVLNWLEAEILLENALANDARESERRTP